MNVRSILVTGDFVIDHHIYEGRRHHFADPAESGVRLRRQLGGAALIHQLLTVPLNGKASPGQAATPLLPSGWRAAMGVVDPTRNTNANGAAQFVESDQAYAFWRPMPAGKPPEKQVWLVSEAMGFGAPADGDGPGRGKSRGLQRTAWEQPQDLPESPAIVVVADGGVDFSKTGPQWDTASLSGTSHSDNPKWIVLKAAGPLTGGSAWRRLAPFGRKLVVIVSGRELRKMPLFLSSGLSWEATVRDLLRALQPGGTLEPLTACGHLIVSFETEGAVWIDLCSQPGSVMAPDTRLRLLYDAAAVEGDHVSGAQGDAYGFQSCLAAAVVRQLAFDPERPDLTPALDGGLCAMRNLREKGHGPATDVPDGFPARRLAAAIAARPYVYSRATFTAEEARADRWNLLSQSQRSTGPAFDLARLVLLRGPLALANVPHARMGAFLTPDRYEIEAVRRLRQLVRRYARQPSAPKPLSIGVFGPPGAGKSFAVKQLVTMVPKSTWLEFNLSQFKRPSELIGAFHQIRDKVLEELLPVAFFDEFDSQQYVWLRQLLAPMQDGRFQDGQVSHPLGRCVLVFAGGTSWTYNTFGPPEPERTAPGESDAYREFRLAKGPDFKSRLDDHLDVVGPNQRVVPSGGAHSDSATAETFGGRCFEVDAADIHFPVRRALMIRAELKSRQDEKLTIDRGLVNALLRVDRYTHGARSLGKIVQALAAARPDPLTRSLLPPEPQLDMHVPAKSFIRLCDIDPIAAPRMAGPLASTLDTMARAIHETYRAFGRQEGWLEPGTDRDFDELDTFPQSSNRAAAERMLAILELAGLRLDPGEATPAEENSVRDYLEYRLEVLAEAEHDGWMAWHLSQGWRYAPARNNDKQEHHCLRPYLDLPHRETTKDRDAIRHFPDVARAAALKVVFAAS